MYNFDNDPKCAEKGTRLVFENCGGNIVQQVSQSSIGAFYLLNVTLMAVTSQTRNPAAP